MSKLQSQVRLEEGVQIRQDFIHDQDLVVTTIKGQSAQPPAVPPANRIAGVLILIVIFIAFFIYAWASEMNEVTDTTLPVNKASQQIWFFYLAFCTLFIVVGFGSIFTYYRYSTAIAFLIPLYTVATCIVVSPIFSKFWFNVFITDFKGTEVNDGGPTRFHQISFSGLDFQVDLYNLKIALANAISQLVVYLYIFGRVNPFQIFMHSLFYNFLWNFNYFLCINIQFGSPDQRIFDDYMTTVVYLFGAAYGLVVGLLTRRDSSQGREASPKTSVQALVGVFFLFLTFCTTTALYPVKFTPASGEFARSYFWGEGFLNCFFAMSGSVIFTYCGLMLIAIKVQQAISLKAGILGAISGGIMYGCVAGTATNIATAIAVGLVAGLISALFYKPYLTFTSRKMLFDTYGGLGFLIIAFIGGFIIAPIVLINYYDRSFYLTTLQVSTFDDRGQQLASRDIAGWVLAYVGVSLGVGLAGGLIFGGITAIAGRKHLSMLYDREIFHDSHGLRKDPKVKKRKMTSFQKAVWAVKGSEYSSTKLSQKEAIIIGFLNRKYKPIPHSNKHLLCNVQPSNAKSREQIGQLFREKDIKATYESFPLTQQDNNSYELRKLFFSQNIQNQLKCLQFCAIKGEFTQEYANDSTYRSGAIQCVVERGDRGSIQKVKETFEVSRFQVREEDVEELPDFSKGFPSCVESNVTLSYPFYWLKYEMSSQQKYLSMKCQRESAKHYDPSANMILLVGPATRMLSKDCGDQIRSSQKPLDLHSFKCALCKEKEHAPRDGKYVSLGRMFDDGDKPIEVCEDCIVLSCLEKTWFEEEVSKLGHMVGMPWLRISPEEVPSDF